MTSFEKFACVILILGGLACGAVQAVSLFRGMSSPEEVGKLLFFLALPLICIAAVQIGWRIRRDDVEAIQGFLIESLECKDVTPLA